MTGWTGGQYSVFRALLACAVACVFGSRLAGTSSLDFSVLTLGVGLLGCVALAVGWHHRIVALALLALPMSVAAMRDAAPLVLPESDVIVASILLILHAATPRAPYGSWAARGRPDPSGGWRMPAGIPHVVWGLLGAAYLVTDAERLSGSSFSTTAVGIRQVAWLGIIFDIWFVVAVFRVGARASAWIAMSLWKLAWIFAFGALGGVPVESGLILLHLFAFDPAWIQSRSGATVGHRAPTIPARRARLFYDGDCGLCHRVVRLILAEDCHVDDHLRFRFAPLSSDAFASLIADSREFDSTDLPDSIVLELENGRVLTRASAALEVAERLGGYWRVFAFIVSLGGLVPVALLDKAYNVIAENRRRFFAKPQDSCPILPQALRERFDL